MKKKVIIIGSGIAGLALAVRLNSKGYNVEVFEKNTLEPKEIMDKKYPKREVFPKNDDFGITAWTYCDYNKAIEKYNELESI